MAGNVGNVEVGVHLNAGTPVLADKRLWLTVGTIAALVALMIAGIVDGEIGAGALVTLATAYMGQSQWGLRERTKLLGGLSRESGDGEPPPAVADNRVTIGGPVNPADLEAAVKQVEAKRAATYGEGPVR